MLPLILAGAIWTYNAVKIAQLRSRNNSVRKRDPEENSETKNLTIYKDCTFEDKRTYNYYNNCTFNTYIIKRGKDKEDSE